MSTHKSNSTYLDSPFLRVRASYQPRYPKILENPADIQTEPVHGPQTTDDAQQILKLQENFKNTYHQSVLRMLHPPTGSSIERKPLRVGVVLSGGQAPGGHNVICGIFDALRRIDPQSELIGFLGGPSGITKNLMRIVDQATSDEYRNTGGFDMLGSGRTKLETRADFDRCAEVLQGHRINALIVIGGDDSNTNAALMAEYFCEKKLPISVIGVPKTIDGDLKNHFLETSFGFDTAVRLYSELIGNIAKDALSARKYYHFIRLMGREASHITLEAALQTQPNVALISEEILAKKMTLEQIVAHLGEVIIERAENGKNFGIILVPEGLVEFVPEFRQLIKELNVILAEHKPFIESLSGFTARIEYLTHKLSRDAAYTMSGLPIDIQRQLIMDRDPHGNVQVSRIETEKLLIELLEIHLGEKKSEGLYKGKFAWQRHFLGYEGRCAAPTNFDADYAYSLGRTAVALCHLQVTGYMAVVRNLACDREQWEPIGVPLTSMMNIEMRHGKEKPVIRKALVSLSTKVFQRFAECRSDWEVNDRYRFTGAIQYFGPSDICDQTPFCLTLELDHGAPLAGTLER